MEPAVRRRSSARRRSRFLPKTIRFGDPGLSRKYFTRKQPTTICDDDLPMEPNYVGFRSPWAFLWYILSLVVPLAYVYIGLMLLRDLCEYSETVQISLQRYFPSLSKLLTMMKSYYGFQLLDFWCIIEALFFIACKLKVRYLQSKDPLEASLAAAPMLDSDERKILWDRIASVESDPGWISEWFLDNPSIDSISMYDILDFICWALFDGRNQEHLTTQELDDLELFVEDLEYRVSLYLYGPVLDDGDNVSSDDSKQPNSMTLIDNSKELSSPTSYVNYGTCVTKASSIEGEKENTSKSRSVSSASTTSTTDRPLPRKVFQFRREIERERPNYFYELYEGYKTRYERYKNMIENSDFHPVKDFRQFVAEAEESAYKSAQNMYEVVVQPGSQIDKRLSAFSHALSMQLADAWNSVKGMKQRLKTAKFLSERRKALMQQVQGNRAMLTRMREMSYAVSSKQMASLMRKITESYEALEKIESTARDGILAAAGKLADSPLFNQHEPKRYAKYSSDPILGIATYPLGMHLILLGATEIPLRFLLKRRSFQKRSIGPLGYYYYPGNHCQYSYEEIDQGEQIEKRTPVVFVHGIGVGLVSYIPLIDALLEEGRPIFLPEIPYVSGFRPWQSSSSVLSPAVVASTMTAMLAFHGTPLPIIYISAVLNEPNKPFLFNLRLSGFSKGAFIGHSFGTSWLSYMVKYAHSAVAALLFLDPICFCLYHSHLTKSFVYSKPDPGAIAYIVRTDMMVNWTIQRAFPWSWIVLFLDQIQNIPCTVFLGDKDALVPAENVEDYFRSNDVPIANACDVTSNFFDGKSDVKACIWRGAIHGAFTEQSDMVPDIAIACKALCRKVEQLN